MKHLLIICLAAWLGANSLMAQEVETDTVATHTENNAVTTHDIKGNPRHQGHREGPSGTPHCGSLGAGGAHGHQCGDRH